MTDVAIVDTGVANLASITQAFRALGTEPVVTRDASIVRDAPYAVLPGVGAFAQGMDALRSTGLDVAIKHRARDRMPMLAVCLGLQLLCEGSEEDLDVAGIELVPAVCRRIGGPVIVPHLGWNTVAPTDKMRWVSSGHAAFANSFCIPESTSLPGWRVAWTRHGMRFVAALERDRTLACQFHPELSGEYGLVLLRRWLQDTPLDDARAVPHAGHSHRIIPCLDVRHGRVVKGVRFQNLEDSGDPAERAARYEAQGADEIVMLDVAAAPERKATQVETVRAVRSALHIPLTVGGGVRCVEDGERLLHAGADKISINTAAVTRPTLLTEASDRFGSQCVVLAIDARRTAKGWEVLVEGGRRSAGIGAVQWARDGTRRGAGEILLTSWDRDGTQEGCDVDLVRAVRDAVSVPVIASGGIGSPEDAADALNAGADAVLAASLFHNDQLDIRVLKQDLAARGVTVRP